MDADEESLLFRLLAYSLVKHLDLRLDAADSVYFELLSERALVRAWLRRHGAGGELRAAIAAAARASRRSRPVVPTRAASGASAAG
jgi:hypothetical protein